MERSMLTWRQRREVWGRLAIRAALLLPVVWGWRKFGRAALGVAAPFLAAWLLAQGLDRPADWCARRLHLPRRVSVLLLILALPVLVGGGAALGAVYAGRELTQLLQHPETLLDGIERARQSLTTLFARLFAVIPPELTELTDSAIHRLLLWLERELPAFLKGLGERGAAFIAQLPSFAVAVLVFLLASYFLAAGPGREDEGARGLLFRVRKTVFSAFWCYLRSQVLLSFGVFCILLLSFLVTKQRYALLLALSLAVLDFIPLLGAGIAMLPWAGVELLGRRYARGIVILITWGAISLYRRVAEPKVVGDQTGLSPAASLFSIYAGLKLAGVPGMILAPVVVLTLRNLDDMGTFSGIKRDGLAVWRDLRAILK